MKNSLAFVDSQLCSILNMEFVPKLPINTAKYLPIFRFRGKNLYIINNVYIDVFFNFMYVCAQPVVAHGKNLKYPIPVKSTTVVTRRRKAKGSFIKIASCQSDIYSRQQ